MFSCMTDFRSGLMKATKLPTHNHHHNNKNKKTMIMTSKISAGKTATDNKYSRYVSSALGESFLILSTYQGHVSFYY